MCPHYGLAAMAIQWANRIVGYADVEPSQLVPSDYNFRRHPKPQQDALTGLIGQIGYIDPVLVQAGTDRVIDGHLRVELALRTNQPTVPVQYVDLTDAEADLALATIDPISAMAYHDAANLKALLDDVSTSDAAVMAMLSELAESAGIIPEMGEASPGLLADTAPPPESASLADRFLVPPFSVLDARQGYWQERKRAWLALGIQSELGRGDGITPGDSVEVTEPGLNHYLNKNKGGLLGFSEQSEDYRRNRGDYSRSGADYGTGAGMVDGLLAVRGEQKRRGLARSFGQDLMRGEHVVGGNLTYATGQPRTDDTSRKILAGGRRKTNVLAPVPPGANTSWMSRGDDGSFRKQADRRSNLNDAPLLPIRATATGTENMAAGTSVFDPVLCELAYRWFCPPGGAILAPFAGGSVRGIVASKLGRRYTGIDLSAPQIAANMRQALAIVPDAVPSWIVGDATDTRTLTDGPFDFVFSCPPYADLEVYSDDPRDLSTMPYDAFLAAYRAIVVDAVAMLADDRFACFVVGDVRDPKGLYRNFVSDTIAAFHGAGARLYNEAILVTAVGSLPIRVGRQFESGRKLGKTHQNVLVFVKGDAKRATDAVGPIELDESLFAEAVADAA